MKQVAISLIFCSFFIHIDGIAQLRTAITGGAHLASVPGNSSAEWDTVNYKYSSRKGVHFGLLTDVSFFNSSSIYFQSGMYFSNKGRKFSTEYDTSNAVKSINARQFINYMEIPLNLVYKKNIGRRSRIILGGGPYASFLFNGWEKKAVQYKNGNVDLTENKSLKVPRAHGKYENIDYGVNALFGFEFGKFFLTANYSQGLSEFYQNASQTGSFKHKVMGATVGLFLSKEKKKDARQRDRDKDGVPDSEDKCPRQKGSITTNGCPDKDGDGVADADDKCPDQSGTPKYHGCPVPDTDNDGVNDDDDKCPDEAGIKENSGCPEIDKDVKEKVASYARRIQFKYKSATLSAKSKTVLDGVVKILKAHPQLNVFIEGYTSSDGNPQNHLRLSQTRAESVKQYLEDSGIKSKRLKATGFGEANPLNKGKTEAERAINRRVELKITNH